MSTLTYLTDDNIDADRELTDDEALILWQQNPEALLDVLYGPSRRIIGAAPPHDHEEDGGESLLLPIVDHSFGTYRDLVAGTKRVGIPISAPGSGISFAPVTTNGITDKSAAKRLFCVGAIIPGGVASLRCSVTEWHESAGFDVSLTVAVRHLSSINYQLGVAPEEASVEIAYTTVGASSRAYQSANLTNLLSLGDPTRDRLVEVSLWLTGDVTAGVEQRVRRFGVLPLSLTSKARRATSKDPAAPQVSVRELKAGYGLFSAQLAAKLKAIYNRLNVGLWGNTPGLNVDGTPDRRRRYREGVSASHQHLGVLVPDGEGGVYSDGACLTDAQSLGFVGSEGEIGVGAPRRLDDVPNSGTSLHEVEDLSSLWGRYSFRRSIPAGCGALRLWVACHPGYTYSTTSYDTSQTLLVSVAVTPVSGGSDIVRRLYSGPYASPLDSSEDDFGFVEVHPLEDPVYVTNASLLQQGKKGWNRGAELPDTVLAAARTLTNNDNLVRCTYRVGPLRVELTYPPEAPEETAHETTDYDVLVRFKMRRGSDGLCDVNAGALWVLCASAPGY